MTNDERKSKEIWKVLNNFTMSERNEALFGKYKARIEKDLECKIEKWAYTQLGDVGENLALATKDSFRDICELAVFVPN